ncbi:hypothetical protein SAMN05421869_14917 [Nonomuraea jiangxiensis]|uniref:Alpha amylase inhibitor n=1 Tax=Nonomuraea jiangxiensis TaxID=633440 RepID=A0A1G9UM79_9ACTN|nr:hypothetical protein SAMN05421869_14917 [Nonomuraea jiangxiensis]
MNPRNLLRTAVTSVTTLALLGVPVSVAHATVTPTCTPYVLNVHIHSKDEGGAKASAVIHNCYGNGQFTVDFAYAPDPPCAYMAYGTTRKFSTMSPVGAGVLVRGGKRC